MIADYPPKYKQMLERDPFTELDDVHDVIFELENKPPEDVRSLEAIIPSRVRNHEIDQWRRKKRVLADSEKALGSQAGRDLDPSVELESRESRELVQQFLALLSPNYQEVLRSHYFEDKSLREIAQESGRSDQSVGMMLNRAMRGLRRLIEQSVRGGHSMNQSLLDTWLMFQKEHPLSIDRMLCSPEARNAFLASARLATGIKDEKSILWGIVFLRKKKAIPTRRSATDLD